MTVFITQVYAAFDGGADGSNDAWAQGQAQWIKDNVEALSGQALVVPGTAGERSSYAVVSSVNPDGTLSVISAYHINDLGLIQQGLPDGSGGPPPATVWTAGVAYVADDLVVYPETRPNVTYRCLQAHTSQVGWEPPNVPALWVAI